LFPTCPVVSGLLTGATDRSTPAYDDPVRRVEHAGSHDRKDEVRLLVVTWDELRRRHVCFEDEAVLVLNKPPGVSVLGERHGTDVVRLAREAGTEIFPVHRIDKATSGAVLIAKDMRHHPDLTRAFAKRDVDKRYLAITEPGGMPSAGAIDLPLSVGRKNRVRVAAQRTDITADLADDLGRWSVAREAVFDHTRVYPSSTAFTSVWDDGAHAVLA
jgi:tRNA pseudouridine32 synthase / 23S rRNA pseudouridine746 synthase